MFEPKRVSVIEASTKSGKTFSGIAWLLEQAFESREAGRHYWWVAPVSIQAKIAFDRMRRDIEPRDALNAFIGDKYIVLSNGSVIEFRSADHPDTLYGEDVYAVVIDEASRMKEEAWHAIRSTLTKTRGLIRIIGNVKGRKNWFYRLARQGQLGHPDMAAHRITAFDAVNAGVLDREEIIDAERILPEAVFLELYMAEASEDVANPFGYAAIDACTVPKESRELSKWYGVDLARKSDYFVLIGIDKEGNVSEFERFRGVPWHEITDIIRRTVKRKPCFVDSTGVGDPIVEQLQRSGCKGLEGYQFTSPSKQKLMEGLALAIHGKTVHFPAGPIVTELKDFEYEYTKSGVRYTAPEGAYDDCVCALALAVMCRVMKKSSYESDWSLWV